MDSDVLHKVGTHPEWNESFYFNFYDRKNDIFAFMRIGLNPNKHEKNSLCFFMMPDGSLVGSRGEERLESMDLQAKQLRFDKIVPEKNWHISFSGPMERHLNDARERQVVSFDVDFESLNPVFNYRECVSGMKEEVSQSIASEHLEQFGRAEGQLRIGNTDYLVQGLGERDHSWGVRDWNAPKMWTWLTCQFSEKSAFNVTKMMIDSTEVDAGFIHWGGKNIPIMRTDIDTQWKADGSPERLDMILEDKGGKAHRVLGKVMRATSLPFAGAKGLSLLHETLAQYTMNSDIGYGVAEYLVRQF